MNPVTIPTKITLDVIFFLVDFEYCFIKLPANPPRIVASNQVHISQRMLWNILPIGALATLGLWEGGKSILIVIVVLLFFALSYYAGGWEHNIYKRKKRELEVLRKKLTS
jgi:hypothetical protein